MLVWVSCMFFFRSNVNNKHAWAHTGTHTRERDAMLFLAKWCNSIAFFKRRYEFYFLNVLSSAQFKLVTYLLWLIRQRIKFLSLWFRFKRNKCFIFLVHRVHWYLTTTFLLHTSIFEYLCTFKSILSFVLFNRFILWCTMKQLHSQFQA